MAYIYAVRGWLELSWPDAEFEGIDESAEEHTAKIQKIRDLLTSKLSPEELTNEETAPTERYKAGWGFPQHMVGETEYIFYGADVETPKLVMEQVREVLALDPFADGYFSVEGEDGEQYRQWIIKSGKIYTRRFLFPDFDSAEVPTGYTLASNGS